MAIVTGEITKSLPAKINHEELELSMIAAFGEGVAWAVKWSEGFDHPIAIRYEYDSEKAIAPEQLSKLISEHSTAKDDKEVVEEKQDAAVQKAVDANYAAERFKSLEARVAALEAASGGGKA